jgi:cholesterol oxidase
MWDPDLGLHGFFWQRVFRDVGIIGASGVGGGSIVWGAVLLQPDAAVFADPAWGDGERDWHAAMEPHYAEAARMLGRTTNPFTGPMDEHLRAAAKAVGGQETFGPVPLAVYFGEEGRTVPDPFFGGEGPERTGCRLCGGCLTGCPYGAKNTLDLNYLHLAERRGAQIRPEHKVVALAPLPGGGYELQSAHPWRRGVRHPPLRARQVVLAAGVLGTLELLFRCRDELGTLPRVSPRLGERVRTNSEAVTVVLDADPATDLTRGPSISTDFHPDTRTHITQNRYVGGGKLLRWQVGPLVDGERPGPRAVATLRAIARAPLTQLRAVTARNFEGRLTALTVMQDLDNELRFVFGRSPVRPWRRVLRSRAVPGRETPSYLPVANEAARAFAASSGGTPMNLLVESAGGRSVTAHVLGGAVMGESATDGVVDGRHEVHGHPGLFVADAAAIPVNLGVNPSLTITALAERFTSQWPAREQVSAEAARGHRAGGSASAESRHVAQVTDLAEPAEMLPTSLGALRRRWGALPAPPVEALLGTRRAVFVGPRALRAVAPRGLGLLGLPRWFGKRFEATAAGVHGVNLLHDDGGLRAHLEMRADIEASRLDGAPALVVTYEQDAPLPWRHIRDEFRALEDGTLLGMTVLDVPGVRKAGTPFLLEVAAPTAV